MRIDILTIFPNFFSGPLDHGVVSRALRVGKLEVLTHDLRSFTTDRHRTADDRPFGGGEGMVLKPEPIGKAIESLGLSAKITRDTTRESVILLSPQGKPFHQQVAQELASLERIVMICGRYEGVDARVNPIFCDREVSIGAYILSGGELAAAVILDAVARLLPGVLGNSDSTLHESFATTRTDSNASSKDPVAGDVPQTVFASQGLLDYPHYTRPATYAGYPVPETLHGGDHAAVRRWRRRMSLQKTFENRPDLLEHVSLDPEDKDFLAELGWRDTESRLKSIKPAQQR